MLFYDETSEAILERFEVDRDQGLSRARAARIREKVGPNALKVKTDPLWRKILEPFIDVFMCILLVALVLSVIRGEIFDGIIIGVIIGVNVAIFYFQSWSTAKILRNLKKQNLQDVSVVREGKTIWLPATELVPGDIIHLVEGEKVPADARVIGEHAVTVDEAILTGESRRIQKTSRKMREDDLEIYEQANMLFAESFIVSGEVTAVVVRTGSETEFGRIADLAQVDLVQLSPMQKKINQLIKLTAIVVGVVAVLVLCLELWNGMSLAESFNVIMAMTVSAVPEGLPVVISVVLVLGMRRMAKKKVLVTNMRAVETMGTINVICTDKTGTLTENKLSVQEVWAPKGNRSLLNFALRAAVIEGRGPSDPLDVAMLNYLEPQGEDNIVASVGVRRGETVNDFTHEGTFPFEQRLSMSGNLWKSKGKYLLVVKGAPEQILARCDLSAKQDEAAAEELALLTNKGYRVIALGLAKLDGKISSFARLRQDGDWQFAGFMAIADGLRPESKGAIAVARHAGVSVRMITGDHFDTAYTIGKKLGLVKNHSEIMDCREMEVLTDDELHKQIQGIYVFSRVTPEQKFRLLQIFERDNITAMTGDGVNDVPALTKAHIGLAMGSGSSIARDAGDIVLLDDNFKSVNEAMREGRTIVENIKRVSVYLFATNSAEMLTVVGALLLGLPLPLLPIQMLWVNVVTDSCLVIPLGLEKPESNVMEQAPNAADAPLLSRVMVFRMLLMAVSMMLFALSVYMFFIPRLGYAAAGTMTFIALVAIQIAFVFNMRSNYESIFKRIRVLSWPMMAGLLASLFAQWLAFATPFGRLLQIQEVPLWSAVIVVGLAIVTATTVVEVHKLWVKRAKAGPGVKSPSARLAKN
ncbi:cation-transporting P-type ATPase [Candidatus Saccharibacteria bacterium]|nr:cation-transporting P-type ATPase [Candidatus Saccharibacteria bacterium]